MKKIFLLISILLSLSGAYAQKHILIKFAQGNIPDTKYNDSDSSYALYFNDPELTTLLSSYRITNFTKEFAHAYLVSHANAEPLDRVYRIETSDSTAKLYSELLKFSGSSVLDGPMYLLNPPTLTTLPDDYGLICSMPCSLTGCSSALTNDLINAEQAWNITTGDPDISIAISDFNFRRTHEELDGKINLDYAFTFNSAWLDHGTRVASLVAGNTNNGVGIASIGYNCKMDLYDMDYGSILDAAMNGARVINCSWHDNYCGYISYFQDLIDMIYDTYHPVIIAGAGNGDRANMCGLTAYHYPAAYNHVIAVSSVGHTAEINTCDYEWKDVYDIFPANPAFSYTRNDKVDLCAPGYRVFSADDASDNHYSGSFGTSFSAPIVSGTAGLILSVNPLLEPEDVEAILKCTARDIYEISYNINYLNLLGWGRIDAGKAVQLAQTWTPGTGLNQQSAPTDIRWFEILSNGTNTIEVEGSCSSNTSGYCNIGFRLEVVHSNPSLTFKWLTFYSESGTYITNSIKYGNSIYLIRGIDYPMTDVTGGSLKACVRVNECVPSIYYSEDRASSCFGPACTYPCPSDIYITGNYSTALTESYTWIKSIGQTTISPTTSVKLDANPTLGYIELKPVSSSDYILSAPTSTGEFIVQAYNGCTSGSPSKGMFTNNGQHNIPKTVGEAKLAESRIFSVFPNPGTGSFTIRHPADTKEMVVVDMYGKIILKQTNHGASLTKINLKNMPAGVYTLRTDGESSYVVKIIKQ